VLAKMGDLLFPYKSGSVLKPVAFGWCIVDGQIALLLAAV
jgi:hypothetical protein